MFFRYTEQKQRFAATLEHTVQYMGNRKETVFPGRTNVLTVRGKKATLQQGTQILSALSKILKVMLKHKVADKLLVVLSAARALRLCEVS